MSIVTELDLLKYRRTKIIATIGPASQTAAVIAELIAAGAVHVESRELVGESDRFASMSPGAT